MTTQRWIITGAAVLAALLLVVAVLLGVLIAQGNAAAERDRFDRARETCEAQLGPMTVENIDDWAECRARLLD